MRFRLISRAPRTDDSGSANRQGRISYGSRASPWGSQLPVPCVDGESNSAVKKAHGTGTSVLYAKGEAQSVGRNAKRGFVFGTHAERRLPINDRFQSLRRAAGAVGSCILQNEITRDGGMSRLYRVRRALIR